jgi:protein subunit release factor B
MSHVYLKGSGPGGQKINKTNSAVQITHIPTGIVVKSQATRSRSQNHKIAARILAEKVEWLERGKESRVELVWERDRKKKGSAAKKSRRKYRALEEARKGAVEGESGGGTFDEDRDDVDEGDTEEEGVHENEQDQAVRSTTDESSAQQKG